MWMLLTLLSAFCWAPVNVLDSALVRHHSSHPSVLQWTQSCFTLPALATIAIFFPVATSWQWLLFSVGIFSYLGDVSFFLILDRLDTSVANAAWAILAVLLGLVGFSLFGEVWTVQQTIGAVLILAGVLLLSFWHRHVSIQRTLLLLTMLAALYLPNYALRKAALLDGQDVLPVFFWLLFGREIYSMTVPLLVPAFRRRVVVSLKSKHVLPLFGVGALIVLFFFTGEYLGALAYSVGPVSLIAIVGNVQPFFVILLAWVFVLFLPRLAPKEIVTRESLTTKIVSFSIVFAGLAILAKS